VDILSTVVIMFACLMLEAFCSGAEIGVVSADQMQLRHDAANGSRGARLALKMLERPEWLLSTTLVGTNIAVVTNTTMATALMISLFGDQGSVYAIILVAPLIWVFGEIVPKSVFQQRADSITPRVIFALNAMAWLFAPLLFVFSSLTSLIARMVGGRSPNPFTLREEIITMMQMPHHKGGLRTEESQMIRRMFNFSESSAGQIMVPLVDVIAVERHSTRGDALRLGAAENHVRLPVYDGRVDQVVGVVHLLDLLGLDPSEPIASHVRDVHYVPASKSNKDLLLELRSARQALAIVVDEFGGAEGIVALEDIMEQVVEHIEDEYDATDSHRTRIRKLREDLYAVSGRTELAVLDGRLGLSLAGPGYTTVAGLILAKAGDVPAPGTVVDLERVQLTVKRATPRAVEEVHVRLKT